ncbi:MAG: DNA polymerase III subunit delta' [Deltaproteobacteria bacterium]|nr:DNA polymerase III subunit delta' [Deltaproteobacteria bacterium]
MPEHRMTRFADVRGHDRVRGFLQSAVAEGRLAHALMFAGSDGIGKRSVALALAARLLCEADGDDACGVCASCRQAGVGSHADLLTVVPAAGKKEIGVDRVRDLKRFMQLQPLGGRAKVVIIDDAPTLSTAAQNALLKTLEEPPPRSFLILIVNNADSLLSTVRSRCQRVNFSPLPTEIVVEILTANGLEAPAAIELAALAEGSPGRALRLQSCVLDGARARLSASLADLRGARYSRLMQVAHELGHPESDLPVKLELVLAHFRDVVVEAIRTASYATADAALRQADLVNEAWQSVRYRNPNRSLLLEALLLQLAAI